MNEKSVQRCLETVRDFLDSQANEQKYRGHVIGENIFQWEGERNERY